MSLTPAAGPHLGSRKKFEWKKVQIAEKVNVRWDVSKHLSRVLKTRLAKHRLSMSRRERLVDNNVLDCDEFPRRLQKFKISNLSIANTAPRRKTKTFNNPNLWGEGHSSDSPNTTPSCFICQEKHTVYKCPLITQNYDMVWITIVQNFLVPNVPK